MQELDFTIHDNKVYRLEPNQTVSREDVEKAIEFHEKTLAKLRNEVVPMFDQLTPETTEAPADEQPATTEAPTEEAVAAPETPADAPAQPEVPQESQPETPAAAAPEQPAEPQFQ